MTVVAVSMQAAVDFNLLMGKCSSWCVGRQAGRLVFCFVVFSLGRTKEGERGGTLKEVGVPLTAMGREAPTLLEPAIGSGAASPAPGQSTSQPLVSFHRGNMHLTTFWLTHEDAYLVFPSTEETFVSLLPGLHLGVPIWNGTLHCIQCFQAAVTHMGSSSYSDCLAVLIHRYE